MEYSDKLCGTNDSSWIKFMLIIIHPQVWYEFRGEPHGQANDVLRKIPKVDSTRPNNFPLFTAQSENGKIKVFRREDVMMSI